MLLLDGLFNKYSVSSWTDLIDISITLSLKRFFIVSINLLSNSPAFNLNIVSMISILSVHFADFPFTNIRRIAQIDYTHWLHRLKQITRIDYTHWLNGLKQITRIRTKFRCCFWWKNEFHKLQRISRIRTKFKCCFWWKNVFKWSYEGCWLFQIDLP